MIHIRKDYLQELVECLQAAISDLDSDAPLVRDADLAIRDAEFAMWAKATGDTK